MADLWILMLGLHPEVGVQTTMGRNLGRKWCDDRGRPGSATGHPFQHLPAEPKLPGRRRAPEHQPQRIYRWEVWRKYTMEHRTVLRALLPVIDPERNITETFAIPLQPTAQSHRKLHDGIHDDVVAVYLFECDFPFVLALFSMDSHHRIEGGSTAESQFACVFEGNRQQRIYRLLRSGSDDRHQPLLEPASLFLGSPTEVCAARGNRTQWIREQCK